jgi:hypothetical protein
MPLDARFSLIDGTPFETVLWDSLSEQSFWVTTPGRPLALEIDPDGWILGRVLYVADPSEAPEPDPSQSSIRVLLGAPQPNPFSIGTAIPLRIPGGTSGGVPAPLRGTLRLRIFDVTGREVRQLALADPAADHRFHWDGRDHAGRPLSPGIYLARLGGDDAPGVRMLRVR